MAELTTLARPYAKAVFSFALANQDLEAWSKMLGTLAVVSQESAVAEYCNLYRITDCQSAIKFSLYLRRLFYPP